jgi:hypothetical protein
MKIIKKLIILTLSVAAVNFATAQQKNKTENIILITLDGFRWQEMFNGADSSFFKQQQHLKDADLKKKYWRDNVQERRAALFPFVWKTIGTKGQLYGNRTKGSKVNVTNTMKFSYPGYNEILTGHADDARVTSNDKFYNPNKNVLEFINEQPAYKGKVAAFTSWDVFPYIINDKRSNVLVSTGVKPIEWKNLNETEKALNKMISSLPNPLGDVRLDAFTFYYGFEYLKKNKPRVMYFAFDETDDFAHGGEYAAYLNSAHYTDHFIEELWTYLQSDPQYKDKTTLIITVDHGRGNNAEDWKHHGEKVENADQIWLAILGPDTPATGEVQSESQVYQNQIAKTLAAFLGLNFNNGEGTGEPVAKAMTTK